MLSKAQNELIVLNKNLAAQLRNLVSASFITKCMSAPLENVHFNFPFFPASCNIHQESEFSNVSCWKKVLLTCSCFLSNYVPAEEFCSTLSSTYIIQDLKPLNMQTEQCWRELVTWRVLFTRSVSECSASCLLFVFIQELSIMTWAWEPIKVLFIVDEAIKHS